MQLESNYMGQIYGLQHKIREFLLPGEAIEVHDTPVIGIVNIIVRGPGYGASVEIKLNYLRNEDELLGRFRRELEKVREESMSDDTRGLIAIDQDVDLVENYDEPGVVWFQGPWNDAKDDAEAYCGNCDEQIDCGDGDWKFCPYCGIELIWPEDVVRFHESAEGVIESLHDLMKSTSR